MFELIPPQKHQPHPDDLKTFNLPSEKKPEEKITITDHWKSLSYSQDELDFDDWCNIRSALQPTIPPVPQAPAPVAPDRPPAQPQQPQNEAPPPAPVRHPPPLDQQTVRRGGRLRSQTNFYGAEHYDENSPLRGENAVTRPWCPGYTREQY